MGLGWSQQEGEEEEGPQQLMPIERAMEKPMEKPTEKTMEKLTEKAMAKPKKLPHNYQAIMQETDSPLEAKSENLYPRLHYGVFLSHKRKKYWVDEQSGHNCFMLFARDLLITWSEDKRYWHWDRVKAAGDVDVEVAVLLDVCWLEVHGKLDSSYLSPGAKYEVAFVVKIEEPFYGWNVPVTLRLLCPGEEVQERKEILQDKPKSQWVELYVGDVANPKQSGEIQFSLFEYQDGRWKRGLIIKGAIIRPKK
ncbi:protein PHLOEM PROTEIN 2-LIKE A1 [Cinnamomum micranthum f. kanehirae]|uniref:Protein PHLOEM PROTEIN 2-LIKE A1 n=1 Tax=Cinnamomum micranthum f. kanehirae TaxID=337451 RepID=A0A3S4P515_9MAGN|nr:protein PHLOEM PROTEIN 2-LIKE A1 [Cinnamomum micranthum f. kanehirae]